MAYRSITLFLHLILIIVIIGAGKVSGGDTVYLCGAITSAVTMQGSGTSGNIITIDGNSTSPGILSSTFTSVSKSYWTLQNVTFAPTATLPIVDIDYGTDMTLDNLTYNASTSLLNTAITADFTTNFTVKNSTLTNISKKAIDITRGTNYTFTNLYITTTSNNVGDVQRDIIYAGGASNIILEKSYIVMYWRGYYPCSPCSAHNDVFQANQYGTSYPNTENITIRYNKLVLDIPQTPDPYYITSLIMLGALKGDINIYGNLLMKTEESEGGGNTIALVQQAASPLASATIRIYNNTIVNKDPPQYFLVGASSMPSMKPVYFKNNIVYQNSSNNSQMILPGAVFYHENNIYYGGGATSYGGTSCGSWKNASESCATSPLFIGYANNDFSIGASSPAYNTGINLGAEYQQQIKPGSTWPNPTLITPTTMSIGVYGNDISSTKQPMPPYLLSIK